MRFNRFFQMAMILSGALAVSLCVFAADAPLPAKPATAPAATAPTTAPAPARPLPPKPLGVGDKVEAKWAGMKWYGATIEKKEPTRFYVKYDDGMTGWVKLNEIRPAFRNDPKFLEGLKEGSEIQGHDKFRWMKSTIVQRDGDKFFIKFDGWPDNFNAWVTQERIRPADFVDGNPPGAGAVAGAGSGTRTPGRPHAIDPNVRTTPPADSKPVATVPDVPPAPPAIEGDLSAVKEPPAPAADWSVKADPAGQQVASFAERSLPLQSTRGARTSHSFERLHRILYSDLHTSQALLVYFTPGALSDTEQTRYQRINLNSGSLLETITLEPNRDLIALSPNGKLGLARVRVTEGKRNSPWNDISNSSLQFLQLSPQKAAPGLHWRPYDPSTILLSALFTDNQHLLTQSDQGQIIYWELPAEGATGAPKAVYRLTAGRFLTPKLSPGLKYFAVEDGGSIRLIETATGQIAGTVSGASINWTAGASYKSDGMLLAVISGNSVSVIHLTSGRIIKAFPVPDLYGRMPEIDWLDQGHLLIGHAYLADLSKRLVVWGYHLGSHANVFGGRVFFVQSGMEEKFTSVALNTAPQVKDVQVKPEDLLVFKPGAKVTIDMNADAPEPIRQQIQKSLEEQVRALGMEIVPDSPLHIAAITKAGESREMQYRNIGFGGGGRVENVTVTDKIQQLQVTLNGEEIWSTQSVASAGMVVNHSADQSVGQAIADEQSKSSSRLAGMKLPPVLVNPKTYPAIGHSWLNAKGIMEQVKEKKP